MLWKLLIGPLLLVALAALPGKGQTNWERTDLFGNPNSLNNVNDYSSFLIRNNNVIVGASASNLFGYWVQYDLQGTQSWRQRGRAGSGGLVDAPWRSGIFSPGSQPYNNAIGFTAIYHWLDARGDTVKVLGRPAINVGQTPVQTLAREGRFYVAGNGDGSGTGQQPLALHYALACLDTAGRLRWQRQYLNPAIRLGPADPQFVGGYAYLWQILEAPRRGLLLLGCTQRDSANFQLYAIETDSAGQPRRTRWVEPFGRRAFVIMTGLNNALRLRDGSGYVLTGVAALDSLNPQRDRSFVARLDTALRVVWRTLLPAPTAAGPADPTADVQPGQVREAPDGSLRVMTVEKFTNGHPRLRQNEFDLVRLSAQGRVLGWDTYCSQVCTQITPAAWQALPDSSVLVSGWGQQRDAATGRLLAQPAWLARLARPCRRYTAPLVPTATAPRGAAAPALVLWPQPAPAGAAVRVAWQCPIGTGGPLALRLADALGRELGQQALPAGAGGEARLALPAALPTGLYVVQLLAAGHPVAVRRLLVE